MRADFRHLFCMSYGTFRTRCNLQLLEQYAEQVSWQSEIRHEAIRFPPMDKMIVDYQVSGLSGIYVYARVADFCMYLLFV